MSWQIIAVWVLLLIVNSFLEKKFPRFYRRIDLPCNILFTLLAAVYCGFLAYAAYDTLTSSVSNGDKIFMVIFIAINISVFVTMVVFTWTDWIKRRKHDKHH